MMSRFVSPLLRAPKGLSSAPTAVVRRSHPLHQTRFGPAVRKQTTTAGEAAAAPTPAAGPKAINPLTGQPSTAKYDKSDWYYINVAFFSVFGVAAPFILLSYVQDEREVRELMRAHCPSVLDVLHDLRFVEIPSDVHPAAKDVVLPEKVAVALRNGPEQVVDGSTPLSAVLGLSSAPEGNDLIAAVLTANAAGLTTTAVSSYHPEEGISQRSEGLSLTKRDAPLHLLARLSRDPTTIALPCAALGTLAKKADLEREVDAASQRLAQAVASRSGATTIVVTAAGESLAIGEALATRAAIAAAKDAYATRPFFHLLPAEKVVGRSGVAGWWPASIFGGSKQNGKSQLDDDREALAAEEARKGSVTRGASVPRYRLVMNHLSNSAARARISRIQSRLDAEELQKTVIPALEDQVNNKRAEMMTAMAANGGGGGGVADGTAPVAAPRPLVRRGAMPTPSSSVVAAAPLDVRRMQQQAAAAKKQEEGGEEAETKKVD